MSLGSRIRAVRLRKGLSQWQLAEKLGMTEANLSNYERDKSIPPSDRLGEIAEILGVSTDYLLGLTDDLEEQFPLDKVMNTVSSTIKELMNRHGVTAYRLAKDTGLSYTRVFKILNGATKNPRISALSAIANYFGVSVDYLLGRRSDRHA